ncbi:DUF3558 domain-containing protein [Rhodococcus chondri]|uniref:DUF3558 domain-containing protein n=1 Tax=Rhodococcus chondri TaxID=3065941 RepID=A0ABU7JUC0_9NOCA|nr:DUF3558 domain-containing protein [Rhodococcus sp. CC-R104]MEE2033615.1 DUF3558 domain-containing protein [Rhodococcus sp. CC-R104]
MLAAAAVTVAACAPEGVDGSSVAVDDSKDATTRAPRIVDDSGRPPVTFDPCLDIPDEVLTEAGYDPRTEDSADYPMGDYTFLGCRYRGLDEVPGVMRRYGLNILSGNVTLDEEIQKDGSISTEISINGRRALLEVDPASTDTCAIALETGYGIVIFSRIYTADHTRAVPREEWCRGLESTVELIEPSIRA